MYNELLNNIFEKYGIGVIAEEQLNNTLDLSVKGILIDSCAGKKCALWGAGRMNTTSSHAAVLIGKYATYLQDLVCVIDSDPSIQGQKFLGYPVIAPEELKEYNVDVVIISSKNSGKSIAESLLKIAPGQKYVDIYGELRAKGIQVYNNFFDEHSIYTEIFLIQQRLKESDDVKEKESYCEQLIQLYLSIKDFYYAFAYMEQYIEAGYSQKEKYQQMKADVEEILKEMKEKIGKRTEDISIFYVDALRAKDVYGLNGELKCFEKYQECAQTYTNVYSLGATTYESMVGSILGRYPLECDVYSKNFLRDYEEFEFLKKGKEKEYQLNFQVSDCYRLLADTPEVNFSIQIYMTQKLWDLVVRLAESPIDKKHLSFVYFPYEIHCPMLCGKHEIKPVVVSFSDLGIEVFPKSLQMQYQECVNYLNLQFDFYYELLGPKTAKIIFSDHSQVVYDENNNAKSYNLYYKDKELTSHIPLIISKEGQEKSSFSGMMSMIDFNQFIIHTMEDKTLEDLQHDFVRYQYYPIHSKKIRNHCYQHGFDDYINGMDIFINQELIYVRTGTGKEEVYEHKNLDKNMLGTDKAKEMIACIEKEFGYGLWKNSEFIGH